MIKCFVDANCILRYLTNDLLSQAEKFRKRLDEVRDKKLKLYLLPITVVEIVYHLKSNYGLSYKETAEVIIKFIKTSGIVTRNQDLVIRALELYGENKIDFVDIYLSQKAHSERLKVISFDRDFDKLDKNIRLKP